MKKYILTLGILFFSLFTTAHQPDISTTMLAQQADDSWILQVSTALTAFEYEVHSQFGKDSYKTPEEFNQLVIRHLEENISIELEELGKLVLKNGFVKLGHETHVVFQVSGMTENFNSISIKNSSFKNIHNNQSALIFLKKDLEKKQFILNDKNNHTIHLKAINKTLEIQPN